MPLFRKTTNLPAITTKFLTHIQRTMLSTDTNQGSQTWNPTEEKSYDPQIRYYVPISGFHHNSLLKLLAIP
jgi:hypothetical protein